MVPKLGIFILQFWILLKCNLFWVFFSLGSGLLPPLYLILSIHMDTVFAAF